MQSLREGNASHSIVGVIMTQDVTTWIVEPAAGKLVESLLLATAVGFVGRLDVVTTDPVN